jgi:hypothetical protein
MIRPYVVPSPRALGSQSSLSGAGQQEHVLRNQMLSALLRAMPTTGHDLDIDVDFVTGDVLLSGTVRTFHAKQMVLHSCRQLATGLNVIDAVTVDDVVRSPCWQRKAPR